MLKYSRAPGLFLCLLVVAGCSGEVGTPEEQIRRLIATGVEAAEARSVSTFEELMHSNYIDQRGNGRKQTLTLMRGLFLRHKSVYLFTKIGGIDLRSETEATVRLHVAMAGKSIADVSALASLRARLYEFELHVIKDDDWRVIQSRWRPANLSEIE